MADTTNLEVVTPTTVIVSEPVEMVVVPGSDGQIGALPRHSKVISILDRGLVDIFNDNKISSQIMIDGGVAEINETVQPGYVSLPNGYGLSYSPAGGDSEIVGVAPNQLTSTQWRDSIAGTPWHKHVPARLEPIEN